ncbi:STAG domain-containing protein [Tricladium varicosporioides]|nr:STAG domain-containing protein [Hymenoscyphus varicosporioides]
MDISNNDVASSPVATGGRRKSGRAVKAPEKFVPDAPSSNLSAGSSKRKRGGNDFENDASDIEEEEELSDATLESAGEEEVKGNRRRAKTTKKPAAKKPKTNGAVSHEEGPAVRLPNRPKKAKKVVIADDGADGLYTEVFSNGESLEDVASMWLNRYQENQPGAVTELVNFILKCAGCDLQVTEDDIEDMDNVEGRVGDVQEEYQSQNITGYPLISRGKNLHAFRTSLTGFFDHLVKAMHESGVMYESPALLENIHIWLATMTSSNSRPFRHTATLIALSVAGAMCSIAHKEIENAARTLRQLESEKKKKGANKARLAEFQKKVANNEQRKDVIENQIKDYFDTVYVHRYRDVDPKIRHECVAALGTWILALPSVFLEGQYLRYMGWMLSDTSVPMRHDVLKQLERIMKDPANIGGMHHFIERFRPRIVEMATRDSEPTVRASAVELLDMIREAGMLEPDDIDVIGKLIFDSEPKVRKALVGFFAENVKDLYESKVEELGGEEALEDFLAVDDEENYDTPRPGWITFKCLSEIMLSYDLEDQNDVPSQIDLGDFLNVNGTESRFTLAAQALYDKVPELREWEMLAGYLLFDHSTTKRGNATDRALKATFKPEENEELILLEILNAVVKLSLTQSDDSESKHKKKNSRMETLEARETTARHLAGLIPRLLKKFGADPKTATVVLRLEHVLNLGVFQDLRQDSTVYAKLLDEISAQFSSHSDKNVLNEAGAAFLHARGYEELEEVTESKLQTLWENTTSALQKLNRAGEMAVRGSLRMKVLTDLSHTLARIEQLSSITNCVEPLEASSNNADPLAINILLEIIARGVFEDSKDDARDALEDEVTVSAMRSSMFYFMWKVRGLTQMIQSSEETPDLDIDQLRELEELFATNLIAAFSSRSTLDPVRLLGAGSLIDLYVLFATLRPALNSESKNAKAVTNGDNLYLESLVQEIPPEVQAEMASIFEGLEKQYARRSKKKLAEPSENEEPEDLESESEEEDTEGATDSERQSDILKAEKQLCEFAGKLVLGFIANVIDVSGPQKGKFRTRVVRNRLRLGPNVRQVLAYLHGPQQKKSHKSKAQQTEAEAKRAQKSAAIVVDEDEDEDPFADEIDPEEGSAEDLRRRELDDAPISVEENGDSDAVAEPDGDEDDIMGD